MNLFQQYKNKAAREIRDENKAKIVLVEFSNKEQLEAAGMILIKCCFDITFRLLDQSIEIHQHNI